MPGRLTAGVYAITDCAGLPFPRMFALTEQILAAGVSALQYRNKTAPLQQKLSEAAQLATLCRRWHTPLIVNDDVDLALAGRADGVHLGLDDAPCSDARARLGESALVGVSCYDDLERALAAQEVGADYVAFGAFFPTTTKAPRASAGVPLLREAKRKLTVPVIAIGGITPGNAAPLLRAGADILAVVSCLYGSDDPGAVVRRFRRLFEEHIA